MADYLSKLDDLLRQRVDELSEQIRGTHNPEAKVPPMPMLLQIALKNEWETALLTSHWVTDEKDADLRIELSRLAGDEAKHFQLIEKRLNELGAEKNTAALDEKSPLFDFLMRQNDTFDRVVSGPYTREALAVTRNVVFLEHCKSVDDFETIALYDEIQNDEGFHHRVGRKYLERLITCDADFDRARDKMYETLQVVDDIQEMIVMNKGVCRIPGC
ncbi:MAG: ferritin-like domain-containing protein [Lentisphaerales bacterium]|nr:ferritin-like domain-containing protein [Lentisphaerales bacterium]